MSPDVASIACRASVNQQSFEKRCADAVFSEMHSLHFAFVLNCFLLSDSVAAANRTDLLRAGGVFHRGKRYLLFEKGASFVFTANVGKAIVSGRPRGLSQMNELSLYYDLPSARPTTTKSRRRRREDFLLLDVIEQWALLHDFNGRHCVLRVLCEAQHLLLDAGASLFHDVLRILMKFSLQHLQQDVAMQRAMRHSSLGACATFYGPHCRLSFLQLFTQVVHGNSSDGRPLQERRPRKGVATASKGQRLERG